jgi:type I restriction enzyme S subunit
MIDWKPCHLSDIINIKHGWAFKGEFFSEEPTDDILLTPGNFLIGGGFKSGKFKYYNGEVPSSYILKPGDVIVTMTDLSKQADTLGFSAKVPDDKNKRYLHNQRIGLVGLKNNDFDLEYIYWLLRTVSYQKFVAGSATGATVKHTSPTKIYYYKFFAPKLKSTQKRIASILSAYDDLIENHLKRIKLMEEIAQRTYEEWFMKFRVNGEQLAIDEATGLPVGWTGAPLGDLISFQKGKKASIIVDEYQNGYEKLLLLDGIESGKYPYTNPIGQVIAERNDLIMLMDGARSSKVFFADKGVVGSTLSKIVIKNSYLSSSLLKHFFEINFGWMQTNNTGAAIPHANKKFINSMPFSIPTLDVFINWKTTIDPIYNKIQNLKDQILLLKQSRDILLPRLMSGTINLES